MILPSHEQYEIGVSGLSPQLQYNGKGKVQVSRDDHNFLCHTYSSTGTNRVKYISGISFKFPYKIINLIKVLSYQMTLIK